MTDQRLSLLTAGNPQPLSTQKRAGADLRLTTRDYGAFELPMLPGASACAFRFCVAPVAKGLPVTSRPASGDMIYKVTDRDPCPMLYIVVMLITDAISK